MRALSAALAFSLVVAAAPAICEPAVGEGVGTYSCAEYTRASASDDARDLLYFSWAQGWMTAWNLAQMDVHKKVQDLSSRPVDDQRAFLKTWCGLHPGELYMKAVFNLYATFKPINAPAA